MSIKNIIHKIKINSLSKIFFWVIINIVLIRNVFADTQTGQGCEPCPAGSLCNPLKSCTFEALIESIAEIAVKIGIPIAAIFIIYSGFLFVTARGSEEKLTKARSNFTWAMIGTAILLGAWVIAKAIKATVEGL